MNLIALSLFALQSGTIGAGAEPQLIRVEGSETIAWTWSFAGVPHFAVSLDGENVARVAATSYDIKLRYAEFDPVAGTPLIPISLASQGTSNLRIVQFATQPLDAYRDRIEAMGAEVHRFLANHAFVITASDDAASRIAREPFVRWVGPYQPAYKLDEQILSDVRSGSVPTRRYVIQVLESGPEMKATVAGRIEALGGTVHQRIPDGYLFEATLTSGQLLQVVAMDEVFWVDLWGLPETDMNNAREIGGGNFIRTVEGFEGEGVRGEIMDTGIRRTHQDFSNPALIIHGASGGTSSHGTSTTGIIFGQGRANPMGTGMMPKGQAIFAWYNLYNNRYTHTAELLQDPYNAVFQSNSWGDPRTTQYTNKSFELDDIIFQNDFIITQSQSNAGTQNSRPQAWAKNIVSVGGVYHRDTLTKSDDSWNRGASIGPAADGRIKPDLTHFYDLIFCPTSSNDTAYTTSFGGTSGATPIVAGHFGLMFQMWKNGVFGNYAPGDTVFEARPHFTTAKAIVINTAEPYAFTGTGHDLTRTHQGWGMPNLQALHNMRNNIFIVDEDNPLTNTQTATYKMFHVAGSPFRATLVYADLPGTTSSSQHRINDLSLKVTSPTGDVYWGNNGLLEGVWSTTGGSANTKDTVENVFVENPGSGIWTVQVIASEINQDQHVETQQTDADFALVVTGVRVCAGASGVNVTQGVVVGGNLQSLGRSDNSRLTIESRLPTSVAEPSATAVITSTVPHAPGANGTLEFFIESRTEFPANTARTIEMFDYDLGRWVVVDSSAPTGSDSQTAIVIGVNADRFVRDNDLQAMARVSWYDRGVTSARWTSDIDHVKWRVLL